MAARERHCDLVVVGSGAAGLSAAVTAAHHGLEVIVVEKENVLGGASAWSGGWMWIPRNRLAREAGIDEDVETVRSYLRHELGERFNAARIDAFLDAAPRRAWSTSFRRTPRCSSRTATPSPTFTATPPAPAAADAR
ncbi:FAD-dependent oxidoreductase [Modicisalibacter radicis]|uniref:FAD-dependent oxidoreductase n=1 Tax=Halomonas sp. EAR18 TaxID=2518972 RepID=UPI001FCEC1B0|nr:FAD-dependent oxidoreductase [Halomonas sp. EAR18]